MSRFALDPALNARVWLGGCVASDRAAERLLGRPAAGGALNLILENPPRRAGSGDRLAAGGTVEELLSLGARLDGRTGAEVTAAVAAFHRTLSAPPAPLVMGVLNVTPDSFSDGGLWVDSGRAVERGLEMLAEGARVLDIGGESTRPGAREVRPEEELRRILPVVEALRGRTRALLSIDTRKSQVARACLEAGADWINDVSGLTFDPALADLVAARPESRLVLMHCRSRPQDERYSTEWDAEGKPVYEDVVADSLRWLRRQAGVAMERGVRPEQLWLDPGFGFGKTYDQNLEVLRRLREYTSTGLPLLVGTSRKSSVGRLVGDLPPDQRLEGTAATVAWALAEGAAAIRVHDVREMARVAKAVHTLRTPAAPD